MSENIDINVGIIKEEISINAANNIVEVNISTAPVIIINPQDYDLSQFTNTSPNPFVQQSSLSSYVPISRNITINGVTQNLTTDRSWTIPGATWGSITGTLAAQTDLQAALDAKVPTTRTLTINGTTQDLSADRTFTISTGITIGTTAITSGTVGRVLFEGTGNVVQQSSSLFWDATNNRLGVGTSSPTQTLDIQPPSGTATIRVARTGGTDIRMGASIISTGGLIGTYSASPLILLSNSAEAMRLFTTGNIGINTTTDAGFRLDVNGTARFIGNTQTFGNNRTQGSLSVGTSISGNAGLVGIDQSGTGSASRIYMHNSVGSVTTLIDAGGASYFNGGNVGIGTTSPATTLDVNGTIKANTLRSDALNNTANTVTLIQFSGTGNRLFDSAGTQVLNLRGGNLQIGTTTDAGFKLDVNGTARISGTTLTLSANNPQIVWSTGAFALYNATTRLLRVDYLGNYQFQQSIIVAASSGTAINASAILEANSTTQGFLPPRMTTTQRNAIASPAAGLVVYDNTDNKHYGYNGTTWNAFY